MGYQYWSYETLNNLCLDAFCKFGFHAEESKIITDVLLLSDLYGIESHGMQRMARYHKSIERGMIKIDEAREVFNLPPLPDGQGQRLMARGEYYDLNENEKES